MKAIIKVPILAMLAVFFIYSGAFATPVTLNDILNPGYLFSGGDYSNYTDTGASSLVFTDTDGVNDDATAFLMLEIAAYADGNALGIYGYSYDSDGNAVLGNTLEIFSGSDSAIHAANLWIDAANGLVALDRDADGNLINAVDLGGITFGVYLNVAATNHTYYSNTEFNADGFDHAMIFDTSDNTVSQLLGADVVIAFEDLWNGGDKSFDDMVVGITDVAPVPEPATMLLLGTGLAGLAVIRRRKINKA